MLIGTGNRHFSLQSWIEESKSLILIKQREEKPTIFKVFYPKKGSFSMNENKLTYLRLRVRIFYFFWWTFRTEKQGGLLNIFKHIKYIFLSVQQPQPKVILPNVFAAMWRHKNERISWKENPKKGWIIHHFMTSHGWFFRHFVKLTAKVKIAKFL